MGIRIALLAGTVLAAVALYPTRTDAVSQEPAVYEVDAVHSSVLFCIRHMSVSKFWGRFNGLSGQYVLDPENPGKSRFDLTVETASVDTNSKDRDEHLRNPDFFNAEAHPKITFKSTGVKQTSENQFEVTGDFTMLGVTKPVTAKVEYIGSAKDPWGGYRSGWEADFTIQRSAFGMNKYLEENNGVQPLGDDVRLIVAVEGVRKQ